MPANDEVILNTGLVLAMDFGPEWLKPIQERLSVRFPALSREELDEYNKVCRLAMTKSHRFIYKRLETLAKEGKKIRNKDLNDELRAFLNKQFSWINDDNLEKLHSQSIYYGYKDGLHLCLLD